MSIVLRGVTTADTAGASGSSITLNVPAGIQNGDEMTTVLTFTGGSATSITPPAGWNLINTPIYTAGNEIGMAVYNRVASNEPASYTWNFTSAQCGGICYAAVGAVGLSSIYVQGTANASSASCSAPSLSAPQPGCMQLFFGGIFSKGTWTAPSGLTLEGHTATGGSVSCDMCVCDLLLSSSGPTNGGSPTVGTNTIAGVNIGWTILLLPAGLGQEEIDDTEYLLGTVHPSTWKAVQAPLWQAFSVDEEIAGVLAKFAAEQEEATATAFAVQQQSWNPRVFAEEGWLGAGGLIEQEEPSPASFATQSNVWRPQPPAVWDEPVVSFVIPPEEGASSDVSSFAVQRQQWRYTLGGFGLPHGIDEEITRFYGLDTEQWTPPAVQSVTWNPFVVVHEDPYVLTQLFDTEQAHHPRQIQTIAWNPFVVTDEESLARVTFEDYEPPVQARPQHIWRAVVFQDEQPAIGLVNFGIAQEEGSPVAFARQSNVWLAKAQAAVADEDPWVLFVAPKGGDFTEAYRGIVFTEYRYHFGPD